MRAMSRAVETLGAGSPWLLAKREFLAPSIAGDLRAVLQDWLPLVEAARHDHWVARIGELAGGPTVRDISEMPDDGRFCAAHVIHDLWRITEGGDLDGLNPKVLVLLIGALGFLWWLSSQWFVGPSGPYVSAALARNHCKSLFCQSRSDTSLPVVTPNTYAFARSVRRAKPAVRIYW